MLILPYPEKNPLSSLVALMICNKLGSSRDHLTPSEVALFLNIPASKVCEIELNLALFHQCRLLKRTPFEFILIYIEKIENRVCRLEDNKPLLLQETVLYSYSIIGRYSVRSVALRSLKAILYDDWGW